MNKNDLENKLGEIAGQLDDMKAVAKSLLSDIDTAINTVENIDLDDLEIEEKEND